MGEEGKGQFSGDLCAVSEEREREFDENGDRETQTRDKNTHYTHTHTHRVKRHLKEISYGLPTRRWQRELMLTSDAEKSPISCSEIL